MGILIPEQPSITFSLDMVGVTLCFKMLGLSESISAMVPRMCVL